MSKRLILLDTHAILHRAYHALPDFASSAGDPTGALYGLCTMVARIAQDLKPDYIVACFDRPEPTYRHQAYDAYKAGRSKTDDALVSQIIRSREVLEALSIPLYEAIGFEADDMLGTITEQLAHTDIDSIIASGDMDTLQLVSGKKVQVYTLKKGINDTILYDEKAVIDRFGFGPQCIPDYKGLRGDPSDNITGIAGIGEKTATSLIMHFGSIEDIYTSLEKIDSDPKVKEAFQKAGIKDRIVGLLKNGKEEAMFSKMLATIRRDAPIHFVLPEKTWREQFSMTQAEALFRSLEFRTMKDRFAKIISDGEVKKNTQKENESSNEIVTDSAQVIDPVRLTKAIIATWLIDSNITNPNLEDILTVAKANTFEQAEHALLQELEKRNILSVYNNIEIPLIPILKKMHDTGIAVDRDYIVHLGEMYRTRLAGIEKEIWIMAGVEFNVASPKQLGEVLFEKMGLKPARQKKTSTGAKSTKESELEKMIDMHPVVGKVLEHRELSKLLSTYIDVIVAGLDEHNRLHSTLIQTGSTTGRMASQNPNLQNVPIKTELGRNIRKAFIADPKYTLVSCDYSQMELRIAAFLSGDEKMIEIFKKGDDVHTAVAAQVFGVAPEHVDKEMRRKAKVINFGIMYGMGVSALKENLGTDRAEAQTFYNAYFATFERLARYLDEVKAETARKGYTETFFGRRRYFQGITSKIPFIKAMAERMAINAPIQGTGADIIKIAMARIDAFFVKEKVNARMLMQVHDELLFEIADDECAHVVPRILSIMESVVDPKMTHGIVCTSEAKSGSNWNDMEPYII